MYGYLTLTHDGNGVEFGYAGQSRQRHGARDRQHRDSQPWADLIVGQPIVICDGLFTDAELDDVEASVIAGNWQRARRLVDREAARRGLVADLSGADLCERHGRRPRYNWLGNEDNPGQVPKWAAVEQRWARDDAAGRPRWVPPADREPVVLAPPVAVSWPRRVCRVVGRGLWRGVCWVWSRVWRLLAGWAAVAVPAGVGLWWVGLPVADAVTLAAVAGVGVVGWWRSRRPKRRRRSRRWG